MFKKVGRKGRGARVEKRTLCCCFWGRRMKRTEGLFWGLAR